MKYIWILCWHDNLAAAVWLVTHRSMRPPGPRPPPPFYCVLTFYFQRTDDVHKLQWPWHDYGLGKSSFFPRRHDIKEDMTGKLYCVEASRPLLDHLISLPWYHSNSQQDVIRHCITCLMARPISWTMRSLTPPLKAAIFFLNTPKGWGVCETRGDSSHVGWHLPPAPTSTSWLTTRPAPPATCPTLVAKTKEIFFSLQTFCIFIFQCF